MTIEQITAQLAAEGLRIAAQNEPGWTWKYINDSDETITLWVTEKETQS